MNLGNDADTTGAIYGQRAGAYYGLAGITAPWRSRIAKHDLILALSEGLMSFAADPGPEVANVATG